MKKIVLVTALILLYCKWSEAENKEIVTITRAPKKVTIYDIAANRIIDIFDMVIGRKQAPTEGFVGRCFGVVKRLKMLMPIMIFKLGVIVTILMFLTVFSLKSMGLLVALLMMNVGAISSKIALWKHDTGHQPPQNVHFHIHPGKDGFHTAPSAPWDRTSGLSSSVESLEKYNLYNKLLASSFSGNSFYNDR